MGKKKTAYIIRYGAYGDHIHCSHIPRLLKEREGFDRVIFEYNPKGYNIHMFNPFIDEHVHFNPLQHPACLYPTSFLHKRWKIISEQKNVDLVINLQNSLEYGYIAMEDQSEYYMSTKKRRQLYGGMNYYDQTTTFAGFPQHRGMVGQLDFRQDEIDIVENIFKQRYEGKFVIIANLSGTSKHKLFYNAEHIIKTFLAKHEDAVCITMGDQDCKDYVEFSGERIINRCGKIDDPELDKPMSYPIRQSMLMTKYANLTIGCESGLMVASTLLGCPTVQLMTAASIKNHGGDFPNDYSVQADVSCSPCHKGAYEYIGCPMFEHLGKKYPSCIRFNVEKVLGRMEEVYDRYRNEKETSASKVSSM